EHLNADGTPDAGFGQGGVVSPPFSGLATPQGAAIAVQADGKVVLGGRLFFPLQFVGVPIVARLNTDGSLDATFHNFDNVSNEPFAGNTSQLTGLILDGNGRIVVVGGSDPTNGGNDEFSISVLAPDGTLDGTFGNNGRVQVSTFGPGSEALAATMS